MTARLPTPGDAAIAIFAKEGADPNDDTICRLVGAAAIGIAKDRAAILARLDEIAAAGERGDPRRVDMLDALRAELRGTP